MNLPRLWIVLSQMGIKHENYSLYQAWNYPLFRQMIAVAILPYKKDLEQELILLEVFWFKSGR